MRLLPWAQSVRALWNRFTRSRSPFPSMSLKMYSSSFETLVKVYFPVPRENGPSDKMILVDPSGGTKMRRPSPPVSEADWPSERG